MTRGCKRIFFCFIAVLFICQNGFAQVNIEALRKNIDAEWSGNVKADVSYNSGNTEFLKIKTGARIDYNKSCYNAFLIGNYQRGLQAKRVFLNKGFLHLRLTRKLNDQHGVEAFVQKAFNDFIDLNNRELIGGGVRLGYFHSDTLGNHPAKFRLFLGVGLMYEHESLGMGATANETNLLRSTNYLSLRWQIDSRLSVNSISYYQVAPESTSDFRILSNSGLEFNISRIVAFRTSLNFRFDNEPPAGVEKHDLELTNGFAVKF